MWRELLIRRHVRASAISPARLSAFGARSLSAPTTPPITVAQRRACARRGIGNGVLHGRLLQRRLLQRRRQHAATHQARRPKSSARRRTASRPRRRAQRTPRPIRRAARKPKKVRRYDPSTRRVVSVAEDSEEAASLPTVTAGRRAAAFRSRVGKTLEQTATKTLSAAARSPRAQLAAAAVATRAARVAAVGRAALALGTGGAAKGVAALGVGGTALAVGAAFAVGYGIGTGLRVLWRRLQPAERNYRKSLAFIAARKKWATEHGRAMTAAEVRDMGAGFLRSLSK